MTTQPTATLSAYVVRVLPESSHGRYVGPTRYRYSADMPVDTQGRTFAASATLAPVVRATRAAARYVKEWADGRTVRASYDWPMADGRTREITIVENGPIGAYGHRDLYAIVTIVEDNDEPAPIARGTYTADDGTRYAVVEHALYADGIAECAGAQLGTSDVIWHATSPRRADGTYRSTYRDDRI